MKATIISLALLMPLFVLNGSIRPHEVPTPSAHEFVCTETTGAWTVSFSQINPFPCGTVIVTAQYNNGDCPAAGDIVVTPTAASFNYVSITPSQLVGAIPSGANSFTVGYMTFSQYTTGTPLVKLNITATGGHTISNPHVQSVVDTCL